LDWDVAVGFIQECNRVLRSGGIIRVVVLDFERYCRAYLQYIGFCVEGGGNTICAHDEFIEPLLLQSVRR